jgi:phenylpyruvate tautomerase PptA (4-oxalocrotonate tautomerase family)
LSFDNHSLKEFVMPQIDIDLPAGLVPDEMLDNLVSEMGLALVKAEGLPIDGPMLEGVGVYLHLLADGEANTARTRAAKVVRVRVLTAPNGLDRDGQRQIVAEATRLITQASGDPGQAERTWVIHSEAVEGGWGIAGKAYGREDFAALPAQH